jgi:hypothetical protein
MARARELRDQLVRERVNAAIDSGEACHDAHHHDLNFTIWASLYCICGEFGGLGCAAITDPHLDGDIHSIAQHAFLDALPAEQNDISNPLRAAIDAVKAYLADQALVARIAELERQRDAVLALCDAADVSPQIIDDEFGETSLSAVDPDDIRAIYRGEL